MLHHVRAEARVGAMWRRRIIVVLKDGPLAAVFERGQRPTYHGGDWLGRTVEAAIRCPASLATGLPVGAVMAQPVPQGFSLTAPAGNGRVGATTHVAPLGINSDAQHSTPAIRRVSTAR